MAKDLQEALRIVNAQYPVAIFEEKDVLSHKTGDSIRYKCELCGRDKFTQKTPHKCKGGYRKRGLKWKMYVMSNPLSVEDQTTI
jgi:hypothetical protein